jgi:hypothetical protein
MTLWIIAAVMLVTALGFGVLMAWFFAVIASSANEPSQCSRRDR